MARILLRLLPFQNLKGKPSKCIARHLLAVSVICVWRRRFNDTSQSPQISTLRLLVGAGTPGSLNFTIDVVNGYAVSRNRYRHHEPIWGPKSLTLATPQNYSSLPAGYQAIRGNDIGGLRCDIPRHKQRRLGSFRGTTPAPINSSGLMFAFTGANGPGRLRQHMVEWREFVFRSRRRHQSAPATTKSMGPVPFRPSRFPALCRSSAVLWSGLALWRVVRPRKALSTRFSEFLLQCRPRSSGRHSRPALSSPHRRRYRQFWSPHRSVRSPTVGHHCYLIFPIAPILDRSSPMLSPRAGFLRYGNSRSEKIWSAGQGQAVRWSIPHPHRLFSPAFEANNQDSG